LFIESICNDEETLERNYRNKVRTGHLYTFVYCVSFPFAMQSGSLLGGVTQLLYSPDYTGFSEEEALLDFKNRIKKYEEVYEHIEDRTFHYIKVGMGDGCPIL